MMKYSRRQDVTSDHRERRWRRSRFGLLDHSPNATDAPARRVGVRLDDAPTADLRGRHVHDADRRCAFAPRDVDHLPCRGNLRIDQVIREQHGKRFVAHYRLRTKYGVPQPERLGLADINAIDARGCGGPHHLEQRMLVPCRELGLQFVGLVEMVLDRALVSPGDEDHVGNACCGRLFDGILDQRLVDDRQHLLGARLGGRQEAAAQPRDGQYGFGDFSERHRSDP
jgi:hypothetical protein